ncbi:polysaccharide pyruvyl transferase family protein [bacterium]|nr:polysaccharide pyruvyl transferase family protein [bacterium]
MKVLYVGDNRNRLNWGCRATSIALHDIISESFSIDHTIYGDISSHYKSYFDSVIRRFYLASLVYRVTVRILRLVSLNIPGLTDYVHVNNVELTMRSIILRRRLEPEIKVFMDQLDEVDALILNAEGSFIFSTPARRDTVFYLALLSIAQSKGKSTFCINGMFSDCPVSARNSVLIRDTERILANCTSVTVRDQLSVDYVKNHLPRIRARYVPDALFKFYQKSMDFRSIDINRALAQWPEYPSAIDNFDFDLPYICVSGSSQAAWDQNSAYKGYKRMISKLQELDLPLLIVPTCKGDAFLKRVASDLGLPCVDPTSNIFIGMDLLARAEVMISGRWHPSIMAAMGGVPCVFLSSNSNKILSLQRMLEYEDSFEFNAIPTLSEIDRIIERVQYLLANKDSMKLKIIKRASELSLASKKYAFEKL